MNLKTGAVYIRVSTNKQDELSPDAQERLILDYAKKNNIIVPEQYIYVENGISGKKADKRPKFQQMIALSKSKDHPIDTILVWKFSRFARNQEESIVYKSLLQKNNVDVISISEPLIDGPFGSLIERIIEWMDEYYSIRLSGEVLRGMTEKAMRGGNQTKAPYGYNVAIKNEPPIINDDEAQIVRLIFDMYVNQGKTTFKIAKYLTTMGYATKSGNQFEKRVVEYILTNPFYCGIIRWNMRGGDSKRTLKDSTEWIITEGRHTPIISKELFDKANSRYEAEHKDINVKRPAATYAHYLSGLIRCSNCGATLVSSHGKNRNGKFYYNFQCNHYNKGQCLVSHAISQLKAEKAIKESLMQLIDDNVIEFEKELPAATAPTDTTLLYKRLDKLKIKEERIKQAYVNEIDTLEEYKRNKEMLNKEREEILEQIKNIESYNNDITNTDVINMKKNAANVLDILESDNFTIEEKSTALRSIVKNIIYDKQNSKFNVFYYLSANMEG